MQTYVDISQPVHCSGTIQQCYILSNVRGKSHIREKSIPRPMQIVAPTPTNPANNLLIQKCYKKAKKMQKRQKMQN